MSPQLSIFTRTKTLLTRTLNPNLKSLSISTFSFLSQEPQRAESAPVSPLPPNPTTGSPVYHGNWRTPTPNPDTVSQSLIPRSLLMKAPVKHVQALSSSLNASTLMDMFAKYMTEKRWEDMKQTFEHWIGTSDETGKLHKPCVGLYNHYIRANLMLNASTADLIDLVAQMEDFSIMPNTASYNLVLKAMHQAGESEAAEKWLQRMLHGGKDCLPDDETYDLLISLLFSKNEIDSALKHVDTALKSGYMLSMDVFTECVRSCVNQGRPDALLSIIKKCKTMDQNKALCPSWNLCNVIADIAVEEDNSELAFYALEFMAKRMQQGQFSSTPVLLSVDEGLILSVLGTAGRTYNQKLLDASWDFLIHSLRQKRVPNPESYLGKIYAHASLGDLQRAFSTLHEFETAYGNSIKNMEEMLSPFTSLYPLVVACSRKGFQTLDSVYFQLENLSRAEPPYKSVAAINCIILGCANVWDLDRAYQTFEALGSSFGLTPDIHSYNALMYAFGKLKKTFEASRVFEHLVSLGVKPNAMSYSLLVDAHLVNRDQKAALSIIDEMVNAGFIPSKEKLRKVRRRCVREIDEESNERVEALAKKFNIRMNSENRKNILFNLQYSTGYA